MSDKESDVFSTIMAFEEVLEVMPDDRGALESVANAYEELGDQKQAANYAMRLVRVLLDEGDAVAAAEWVAKLRAHADDNPEVNALIEEVESLTGEGGKRESSAPSTPTEASTSTDTSPETTTPHAPTRSPSTEDAALKGVSLQRNLADEMAFAWNLLQVELLSEEEYSSVVQDLSELATAEQAGTVSVLHVLRGRGHRNLDKIMVAVARDAYMPLIDLQCFDIQLEAAQRLPFELTVNRGALAFEHIGPEILVALLNPFDDNLRKNISTLTESKCHWYLTTPDGFDKAVAAIKELLA